tara:strand:- start:14 stop:259 length:246 start_codon:yes stop_codon:yes gene_type:complete
MTLNVDTNIKSAYTKTYPTDELGVEINPTITFTDLFYTLDRRGDVYECIGVDDSLVRERCFELLSKVMKCDYDYIYNQWLL